MKPDLFPKQIIFDDEAREKIKLGVETMYKVARAAYGPKAGNVMYEHNWPVGAAKISRDGVTNLDKVTIADRAANIVAKTVHQASKRNNAVVGDGTTAAAILTYHLYMAGQKLVSSGHNQMEVARMIDETAVKAIEYVDSIKQPFTEADLLSVATISCGDAAIAELLADTVKEVGDEGGVTVEEHTGLGVYAEVIDGFYMRKGFADVRLIKDPASLSSDFENVPILLVDKIITDAREMATIVNKIVGAGHKELLILGDVAHDALEFLIRQRNDKIIVPTIAGIPATAGMKSIVLDDVAALTGGKVYQQGDNPSDFSLEFLGAAKRAIVEELNTTIIDGAGEPSEIERRLKELETQLNAETAAITTTVLKDRISRLKGKVGIVKVGAPTDIDREELRLRIDDAVCALQAARRDGTVPGGGTALARVTGTPFDSALQQLFVDLLHNAGEKAEYRLGQLLDSEVGYGFNLQNISEKPVDLRKEGVIDPTLVIKEVVRNAASIAKELITTTVLITFSDDANDKLLEMVKTAQVVR
jgi:chaperonin GroEL